MLSEQQAAQRWRDRRDRRDRRNHVNASADEVRAPYVVPGMCYHIVVKWIVVETGWRNRV